MAVKLNDPDAVKRRPKEHTNRNPQNRKNDQKTTTANEGIDTFWAALNFLEIPEDLRRPHAFSNFSLPNFCLPGKWSLF